MQPTDLRVRFNQDRLLCDLIYHIPSEIPRDRVTVPKGAAGYIRSIDKSIVMVILDEPVMITTARMDTLFVSLDVLDLDVRPHIFDHTDGWNTDTHDDRGRLMLFPPIGDD